VEELALHSTGKPVQMVEDATCDGSARGDISRDPIKARRESGNFAELVVFGWP